MASVFKGLNVKIDAVSVWIGGYIMRIQAANTFYTGTYSVLNTKSSFPYAVKVEGYGKTRNQRSLFQAADLICTLELLRVKTEHQDLSNSEKRIFHSKRDLKKDFLKGIQKKEFV